MVNEKMSENSAHNKQGSKGYRDFVISKIEQSQLAHSENNINVRELSEDPETPAYNVNPDLIGKSYGAETKAYPELEKYPETSRFSFMHQIDEKEFKKNAGMPKVAKNDNPSD